MRPHQRRVGQWKILFTFGLNCTGTGGAANHIKHEGKKTQTERGTRGLIAGPLAACARDMILCKRADRPDVRV